MDELVGFQVRENPLAIALGIDTKAAGYRLFMHGWLMADG